MRNIIVSAGHGDRDPGAISGDLIEHLQTYPVAWHLRSALEAKGCTVEFISCFQTLAEKIRNVNALHDQKNVDLAIEVHFNFSENPAAHGTEVLFYNAKLEPLAKAVSASLSEAIGTFDRGAKHRTDLGWVKQTQCPALIVEVCFINNLDDAFRIAHDGFHLEAAKGIAAAI